MVATPLQDEGSGKMTMRGNALEVWDYLDLALLWLAKSNRNKLKEIEDNKEFYEEFFTENDARILASEGDPRRRLRGSILRHVAAINVPDNGLVLDVGCGTGDNLRYIMRPKIELHGIEYSENSARIAKGSLGRQCGHQDRVGEVHPISGSPL